MVSKRTLAEQAIHVEQNVIGENVGIQDQTMAAYGGMQIIEMGPGNQFKVAPMILPSDYRKNFEQHVLLGFTGFTRTASEVAQGQIDNIKAGKSDVPLKAIYELAQEGLRLFTEGRPVSEIGRLIDQSWQIKRSLSTSISSEAMDEIYKTAMDAGAYGGRLMGAGGGGFMFFLAPPDRHNYIKYRLNQAVKVWVPFAIDDDGAQVILYRQ
jgi:D-glycero-alpha-D-manno-heptose-7-phosphate kinase